MVGWRGSPARHPMNDPRRPKANPVPAIPETHDDAAARPAPDWEAIALSRVARRVDALTCTDDVTPGEQLQAFGWEAVALANLRRHLRRPGTG